MKKPPKIERRRAARVNVSPPPSLDLVVPIAAQVLEISVSGVLLRSKRTMALGERGTLRSAIGARPLEVAFEIRSVAEQRQLRGGQEYRVGAAFVDVTPEQRVLLAELLKVERS